MIALAFLLGIPLVGGLVLGLVGHRDPARDVNVAFSAGTFGAATTGGRGPGKTSVPLTIVTPPAPVMGPRSAGVGGTAGASTASAVVGTNLSQPR